MAKPWIITLSSTGAGGGGASATSVVGTGGDYATLAAALTAGATHITLKPGSYSGAVTISQSDVTIVGYGATWTENVAASTFIVSGNNVTVEGIAFSGSHDGDDGDMTGYSAVYTTGNFAKVRHCRFVNLRGFAVQADAADDIEVGHCYFENVGIDPDDDLHTRYCVYITNGSQRPYIHHNYITGWSQAIGFWFGVNDGVAAYNRLINNCGHESSLSRRAAMEDYGDSVQNTNNRWLFNYVDGSTGAGLELAQGLKGTLVQGNTFKNAGKGYTSGNAPLTITGGDGGDGGEYSEHIRIVDNDLYGWGSNTYADSVLIFGGCFEIEFSGNRFYDIQNSTASLQAASGTTGIKFNKNVFRTCGGGGQAVIRLSTNNCLVESNDIVSAVASTRGIFAESSDGHIIANNNIDVTGRAIEIQDDCEIAHNRILSLDGTAAITAVNDNRFLGNRATNDSSTAGANVLRLTGTGNEVHDNHMAITDAGYAVIYCNTANNRFHRNQLSHVVDGGGAIQLDSSSARNVFSDNTYTQPDNSLSIYDTGSGNRVERNHTPTTLGT
jgi:hypothetical protein